MIISITSDGVKFGFAAKTTAAALTANGVAIDVPPFSPYAESEVFIVLIILSPGAAMSTVSGP